MALPATIAPGSFDTSLDIDDECDVVLPYQFQNGVSEQTPSPSLYYHIAMAKLARVIQAHIKAGRGYSGSHVAEAMEKVEIIYKTCPLHVECDVDGVFSVTPSEEQTTSPWIPFQRYLLTHTFHFIRLTIIRVNFSLWLHRQPDQYDFHRKAIDAAEAIVKEKDRNVPQMYRKSWYVSKP